RCLAISKYKYDNFEPNKNFEQNFKFAVWQYEQCPRTKRNHIQGYIELIRPISFEKIQEIYPTIHVEEKCKNSTQEDCIKYCSKEDTRIRGPFRKGISKHQGKRNDLKKLKEEIDNGRNLNHLWQHETCYFENILKYDPLYVNMRRNILGVEVMALITSNYHLDLWYDKLKVDYKALYRRIKFLFEFKENNVICHINNPPSDDIPTNILKMIIYAIF
ncbi:hypothetical protein C1645_812710, partial [Glomus cerebriforme]